MIKEVFFEVIKNFEELLEFIKNNQDLPKIEKKYTGFIKRD